MLKTVFKQVLTNKTDVLHLYIVKDLQKAASSKDTWNIFLNFQPKSIYFFETKWPKLIMIQRSSDSKSHRNGLRSLTLE